MFFDIEKNFLNINTYANVSCFISNGFQADSFIAIDEKQTSMSMDSIRENRNYFSKRIHVLSPPQSPINHQA